MNEVNCSESERSDLTKLLYALFVENFILVFLVVFLVLFFGKIAINGVAHSEYVNRFKVKCKESGGVTFVPKGVKGWPMPECRNPSSIINIDV